MRKETLTLPMLVSFNELAWIAVFALVLLYNVASDQHNMEANKLTKERDEIQIQLNQRTDELNKMTEDHNKAQSELNQKIGELEKVTKELDKAREEHNKVSNQLAQMKKSNKLRPIPIPEEPVLKQQLIGLQGKLKRVAIIVDQSGSMAKGGQWQHARSIIRTWLEHLPIEQAVLITFNDTATSYPSDGTSFLDMSGPEKEKNRAELLQRFDLIKPGGNTNTLNALRKAYEYDLDTIILFTDGFPDSGSERFDKDMAEEIYTLCKEHGQNIPINTVGLGSYFGKQFGEFLHRLPKETGGSFIGR